MSSIVAVKGTYAERQKIRNQIGQDMYSFGSCNSTSFYLKEKGDATFSRRFGQSDVICISGKGKVRTLGPDEPRERPIYNDLYLSPDFYVVLEGQDTMLYNLHDKVPKYHAELGMIKTLSTIAWALAFGILALISALYFGLGWWSIYAFVLAFIATVVYFVRLEYPIWASIAAVRGALYIWKRILFNAQLRSDYQAIVEHLGNCDEVDLAGISKRMRHLV